MNYEERYNQALERAKKVHDGELTISPNEVNDFNVYEYIFPELKESEDERIKNEIIAFVEQSIHRGGGTPIPQEQEDKWIAWIEKQGEQNWKPSEEQMEALFEAKLASTKNREYFLGLLYEDLKKL